MVIVGNDGFLSREVRRAAIARLCGDEADAACDVFDGETAELRDVLDALGERSLFGGERRVVVLENADPFVKDHRPQLEDYVAKPIAAATLLLEVASWPSNTRLAKAAAAAGVVVRCQAPDRDGGAFARGLKAWLIAAAQREVGAQVTPSAVDELLERLPAEAGILYQEIIRLSLLAGASKKIDPALVREHVGGWRTRKTWDMIDAAADGRTAEALEQFDRLIAAGEEPWGLLPQMAFTLRQFALALRLVERAERRGQRLSVRDALAGAGTRPFKLGDAERQLRQLGRPRARRMYRWLLDADLEIKGHNSGKEQARRVLETLIIRLSRQAELPTAAGERSGR
jgi:DNA polymerase-3 subunit delta